MFNFGGETAQQLLCWAVSSGLLPANPTCESYGMPVQFAQSLITWGPTMLVIGVVMGVPVATWVVLKIVDIFTRVSTRV
jgi:hypothetical protein